MTYRLATMADWPAITEYVNGRDYFMPMNPALLGGIWLIAVSESGTINGTIWFFDRAPNAYVDYWAADSPMVAAKLGATAEALMRDLGVRYVRGVIGAENENAVRLAAGLGMATDANSYVLSFKRIEPDGTAENRDQDNHPRSKPAGVQHSPAPC